MSNRFKRVVLRLTKLAAERADFNVKLSEDLFNTCAVCIESISVAGSTSGTLLAIDLGIDGMNSLEAASETDNISGFVVQLTKINDTVIYDVPETRHFNTFNNRNGSTVKQMRVRVTDETAGAADKTPDFTSLTLVLRFERALEGVENVPPRRIAEADRHTHSFAHSSEQPSSKLFGYKYK
jgi:hypothetical protein